MVSANGAVVNDNVPRPEGYGVPLELDQRDVRAWATRLPTFFTSKRFLSPSALAPALATFAFGAGASVMFTSAMVYCRVCSNVGMRGASR